MAGVPRYIGVCPQCGRKVATTADGVVKKNHRPDPKKPSPLCKSWGLKATSFKKVEQ